MLWHGARDWCPERTARCFSAIQFAITLNVALAVSEIVLTERLHLYGTLSLSQRAERSRGDYRTDYDA